MYVYIISSRSINICQAVDYNAITPYAVKGIQEQQSQLVSTDTTITAMEGSLNNIRNASNEMKRDIDNMVRFYLHVYIYIYWVNIDINIHTQ